MNQKKTVNIMTSCDENLVRYVPVLLQSIADALRDKEVHFFFLYHSISEASLELFGKQCEVYGNLDFNPIQIGKEDMENYQILASAGGQWCPEAYFSLMAHELLPADVDRVLYLDAADTLVIGNIDDYYFSDFEEKFIIATGIRYKEIDDRFYIIDESDIENPEGLAAITRGLFNSGSYVMNLTGMREDGRYTFPSYLELAALTKQLRGTEPVYWGDQGFLSTVFLGNIKYYGYPERKDYWYMPYNFCLWYYNDRTQKPDYDISILHFAGAEKPWHISYPTLLERFQPGELRGMDSLRQGQEDYYMLWYETALKTEHLLDRLQFC